MPIAISHTSKEASDTSRVWKTSRLSMIWLEQSRLNGRPSNRCCRYWTLSPDMTFVVSGCRNLKNQIQGLLIAKSPESDVFAAILRIRPKGFFLYRPSKSWPRARNRQLNASLQKGSKGLRPGLKPGFRMCLAPVIRPESPGPSAEGARKLSQALEAKKPRSQVVSIALGFRNAIKVQSKNAEPLARLGSGRLLGSLASWLLGSLAPWLLGSLAPWLLGFLASRAWLSFPWPLRATEWKRPNSIGACDAKHVRGFNPGNLPGGVS